MNIEDTMGVEELRRELRRAWDIHYGLIDALNNLPEVPEPRVLSALSEGAKDEGWMGKIMQRRLGLEVIPPVSECERGAGLWFFLRNALRRARNERTGTWWLKGREFALSAWTGSIYEAGDRADLAKELRRKIQGVFEQEFAKKKSQRDSYVAAERAAERVVKFLLQGACVPCDSDGGSAEDREAS